MPTKTNIIEKYREYVKSLSNLSELDTEKVAEMISESDEALSRQKEEFKKVVEERLKWLEKDTTSDEMIPVFQVKRVFAYILKAIK